MWEVLWGMPVPQLCLSLPRAAKQRRKGDRLVIACQEQTYWLVNRPPVSPGVGGPAGVSVCASMVPWVTGGSSSVAHQNLESTRPGLRLPPLTDHGAKCFSLGLRERPAEAVGGPQDPSDEASGAEA